MPFLPTHLFNVKTWRWNQEARLALISVSHLEISSLTCRKQQWKASLKWSSPGSPWQHQEWVRKIVLLPLSPSYLDLFSCFISSPSHPAHHHAEAGKVQVHAGQIFCLHRCANVGKMCPPVLTSFSVRLQRITFLHGPIQVMLVGVLWVEKVTGVTLVLIASTGFNQWLLYFLFFKSLIFMVPTACSLFPQRW